jgi:hypothetical protein
MSLEGRDIDKNDSVRRIRAEGRHNLTAVRVASHKGRPFSQNEP